MNTHTEIMIIYGYFYVMIGTGIVACSIAMAWALRDTMQHSAARL